MSQSPDRIGRVVFETSFHGRERVSTLQNRISAFAVARLQAILAESLALLAGREDLLIFYSVELDLGKISFGRLEEDLEAGMARCLRDWALRAVPLHRRKLADAAFGSGAPGHRDASAISLANLLSASRSLASPAPQQDSPVRGGLNAAVASALRGSGDWPQLLAIVRENQAFRIRLANEVSPELLRGLLQSLVPANGTAMAEFARLLVFLHDAQQLVCANRHAFQRVVWECVLTDLAHYQTAGFSPRAFLSRVLEWLAARYSVRYSLLAAKVDQGLRELSRTSPSVIPANILREINTAVPHGKDDQLGSLAPHRTTTQVSESSAANVSSAPTAQLSRDLAFFLEWGVLPSSTLHATRHHAESEMLKCLAAWPDELCTLVRRLGAAQPVRKRIAGQFSENVVHRLIAALDPVNAPWMILFTRQLRRLHAQKPLVPLQNRAFAQLLWELTLEYLAERHWHALDAGSFLRFLLQRLAVRQHVAYEFLLADLALRRSPDPQRGPAAKETGTQALVSSTIVALLEDDVLGVSSRLPHLPRFVVQTAFHHLFCDLDVLAYWLRWRRLPAWTLARDPEEVARHIGPLLLQLPPEIRGFREKSQQPSAPSSSSPTAVRLSDDTPPPAVQIERWLLFGVWPAGVALPQNALLVTWLEGQNDFAWLRALQRCGARDQVVHRLVHHLSSAFQLRIAGLLAGPNSQTAVRQLLSALQAVGLHIAGSFLPPWREQVSRSSLVHLLRNAAGRGHTSVSVEELAHCTLQGLSLRCQVSYERLLIVLRKESQGEQQLEELCRSLETRLEHQAITHLRPSEKPDLVVAESTSNLVSGGSHILVLHYLQYGSLPASACELSLMALRKVASQIADDQLTLITRPHRSVSVHDEEVTHRARILFSAKDFVRFSACISGDDNAIDKADNRAAQNSPAVAERLGTSAKQDADLNDAISANLLHGRIDALAHLLRTGNLPWWGDPLASPTSSWFTASLKNEPSYVLRTLRSAAASPQAIDRLMRYVPQRALAEITCQAAPECGRLLTLYIEVGSALSEDKGLSTGQRSRTTGIHWRETLLFVLDESPASSIPVEILRTLSRRVSQQLGLPSDRYVQSLCEVAQQRASSESRYLVLAQMLSKIRPAPSRTEEKSLTPGATHPSEREGVIDSDLLADNSPKTGLQVPVPQPSTRNTIPQKTEGFPNPELAIGKTATTEPASEIAANDATVTDAGVAVPSGPIPGEHAALKHTPASVATDTEAETNAPLSPGSITSEAIAGHHISKADREFREKPAAGDNLRFADETTQIGQLEYLLRYGALPAPAAIRNLSQFMDDLAQALAAQPQAFRPAMQEAVTHDLERKRIARLFSPHALSSLWPLLLPANHAQAVICLETLQSAAVSCSTGESNEQLRQTCVEELLCTIGNSQGTRWENAVYLRRAIQRLAENHSLRLAAIVEHLRQHFLLQPRDIQLKLNPALERAERETAIIPLLPASSSLSAGQPPASGSRPAPSLERPSSSFPAGEPFYIGNAGIILLWPFLTRYFQNLGLVETSLPGKDKSAFRGEMERSRAIHLMQYLATGKLEAPEHELLLNKILCGASAQQPLEAVSPVTDAEKVLSTQMLSAVIGNWQKLRNTSIEGLRQSFLLREGRLLRRDSDEAWSLTVSVKGYDILLDSLPWRFSTVRLPWMQTVVHVKWR